MSKSSPVKRRIPSPAFVLAIIALVAALAGSAVALPGKNKVDANDVKKNAISSKQVKAGSLNGSDLKNGSVAGADVTDESLTGADVAELGGADINEASLAGPLVRSFSTVSGVSGDGVGVQQAFATCPVGTALLGGGGRIIGDEGPNDYALTVTLPIVDEPARQYYVQAEDVNGAGGGDNDTYSVRAYATCAVVG